MSQAGQGLVQHLAHRAVLPQSSTRMARPSPVFTKMVGVPWTPSCRPRSRFAVTVSAWRSLRRQDRKAPRSSPRFPAYPSKVETGSAMMDQLGWFRKSSSWKGQ
jgi:hypothetical protein